MKLTAATLKASATLVAAWHELDSLAVSGASHQDEQGSGSQKTSSSSASQSVDASVGLGRLSELAEDVMVEYPYVSMADRSDVVDAFKHAFREVGMR